MFTRVLAFGIKCSCFINVSFAGMEFVSLSEELPSQEEAPAKDIGERHVSADSQIKSSRGVKNQEHVQKHPKLCKAPGQLLDKKAKPLSGSQQEDGSCYKPADRGNDCLLSAMEKLVESAHFGIPGNTVDMFVPFLQYSANCCKLDSHFCFVVPHRAMIIV